MRFVACLYGPVLGIGLTGCTVGPDYQRPEVKEAPLRATLDGESVPSRTVAGAVERLHPLGFPLGPAGESCATCA